MGLLMPRGQNPRVVDVHRMTDITLIVLLLHCCSLLGFAQGSLATHHPHRLELAAQALIDR